MSNISLGRYVPYKSFIHKMDPRTKVFALIALMVAIFISYSTWEITFIVGGALFILIFVLLLISHVSIKDVFKQLRIMWFLVLVLLVVNTLIPPANANESDIAFWIVHWSSIFQSLKIILRLVLMIEITMVLTATTKPLDLTYAFEWYMTPLKVIKFPAHEVAMVISIALRFIPTLLEETTRIMNAQESRGVDFKHGSLGKKIKAIVSLIVPLFVSAFQRADELADSMEARGYDPKAKRTRYRCLKFGFRDCLGFIFTCVILASTIVVSVLGVTL